MDLHELFQMNILMPWIVIIGFLGSIGIEIAPIKISPWSALFKWMGRQINSETNKEIKDIKDKIDHNQESINKLAKDIDVQAMETYRWTILRFANDIRIGTPKSKDEFMHIFDINNKYHHLIEANGFKNGLIDTEMGLIRKRYEKHCIDNGFLA